MRTVQPQIIWHSLTRHNIIYWFPAHHHRFQHKSLSDWNDVYIKLNICSLQTCLNTPWPVRTNVFFIPLKTVLHIWPTSRFSIWYDLPTRIWPYWCGEAHSPGSLPMWPMDDRLSHFSVTRHILDWMTTTYIGHFFVAAARPLTYHSQYLWHVSYGQCGYKSALPVSYTVRW